MYYVYIDDIKECIRQLVYIFSLMIYVSSEYTCIYYLLNQVANDYLCVVVSNDRHIMWYSINITSPLHSVIYMYMYSHTCLSNPHQYQLLAKGGLIQHISCFIFGTTNVNIYYSPNCLHPPVASFICRYDCLFTYEGLQYNTPPTAYIRLQHLSYVDVIVCFI